MLPKNSDGKSLNRIRTINLKHEQKRKHETEKEKLKLKLDQNLQDWEKDKRMQRRKIETLEHSLALSNDSQSKLKEDYRRQMAEIESLKRQIKALQVENRSTLDKKSRKGKLLKEKEKELFKEQLDLRKGQEEFAEKERRFKNERKKFKEECQLRRDQLSKAEKSLEKQRGILDAERQSWKADVVRERLLAQDDKKAVEKARTKLKAEKASFARTKLKAE